MMEDLKQSIMDRNISIEAKAIFLSIYVLYGGGDVNDSVDDMAYLLNITSARFRTHFKQLVKNGYVSVENGRNPSGRFNNRIYRLHIQQK
jgi:hypothetical protein